MFSLLLLFALTGKLCSYPNGGSLKFKTEVDDCHITSLTSKIVFSLIIVKKDSNSGFS